MLYFRNIVTAFLFYDNQVLLMKRGEDRKIAPGYWFGVGGHMEPEEINNPHSAIYREILEETGISKDKLADFNLKYIVYNKDPDKDEVVVNHIFFGKLSSKEFVDSAEGKLFWIDKEDALTKEFHPVIKIVLANYFKNKKSEILLGVAHPEEPYTWWYPL